MLTTINVLTWAISAAALALSFALIRWEVQSRRKGRASVPAPVPVPTPTPTPVSVADAVHAATPRRLFAGRIQFDPRTYLRSFNPSKLRGSARNKYAPNAGARTQRAIASARAEWLSRQGEQR